MKLFSLNEMAERTTLEGRKPLQLKYQTVRWTVVFTLGHSLGGAFHGFTEPLARTTLLNILSGK